jgi:hypothetical protein
VYRGLTLTREHLMKNLLRCAAWSWWVAASVCAGSGPIEDAIDRVREGWGTTSAFEFKRIQFVGVDATTIDATDLDENSPGIAKTKRTARYTCAADGSVIVDQTHEVQSKAGVGIDGMIISGEFLHYMAPGADQIKCIRLSPLAGIAWCGTNVPSNMWAHIRHTIDSSPTHTVEPTPAGGWTIMTESETFHIEPDGAVSATESRDGTITISSRVVEWQHSPLFKTRIPRVQITEVRGTDSPLTTATLYTTPQPRPPVTPDELAWWKYAREARDTITGITYGLNNVELPKTVSQEPGQAPQASGTAAGVFVDPGTVAKNAEDPSSPILPLSRDRTRLWFLVTGGTCFVLAAAWFIRRRMV